MKRMLLLLLSLILISNECTLKTHGAGKYKAQRIEIRQNISPKKLQLIEKIYLEENDDVIINQISGIEIFEDATKLVLSDAANRIAVLYDFNNGKILKIIDSKDQNNEWYNYFLDTKPLAKISFRDDLKFIPISECSKYGITEEGVKLARMHYFFPKSINNRVVISNLMYAWAVSDKEKHNSIINRSGFCWYDNELNFEKMVVPEVVNDSYIISGYYVIQNNGDIIGTSSNFIYKDKDVMDSLVTVSRYDSTGKLLGNIGYLPEKYSDNKLAYEELWKPFITSINDSIFIAYPRVKEIYAPSQKVRFSLINLPFSNDSGLVHLYNYYQLAKIQQRNPDSKEIGRLLPLSIVNTFNSNGNYGVIILVFDETEPMGFYYIAQEYDIRGNLLSHTKFYDEPENQIRDFVFDKANNQLCIVRKSKNGWSIEKRKW